MAAPTFVAEYEVSSWDTSTTPKTVTPTTAAGDVLAVLSATEDNDATLGTPSGNSHTYTLRQESAGTPDNASRVAGWTCTATAAAGWTLTQTRAGTALKWGLTAMRFSGSTGVGGSAVATAGSGGPTLNVTTTGANSAVVVIVADWNAVDGATRTWRTVNSITPTAGNGLERVYFRNGSNYTVYAAYYSDVGAAGVKTVGLSAPVGQVYSIVAIEILGTASGVTATLGATLPAVTSAWTGENTLTSTLGGVLPALTAALTGRRPPTQGSLAGILPSLSNASTGLLEVRVTLTAGLPAIAAAGVGDATVTGSLSGALSPLTVALVGESTPEFVEGDLTALLPALEAAFVGGQPTFADLVAQLPAIVAELTGSGFEEATLVDVRPHNKDANITFVVKWPPVRGRR